MDLLKFGKWATWFLRDNGKVVTRYSRYGLGTPCRASTASVAPGFCHHHDVLAWSEKIGW